MKRKTSNISGNLSIYSFNTFDEYLDFCQAIPKNTYSFFKNSSLLLYKSKYYLVVCLNSVNINLFKQLHYLLIEFSSHLNNCDLFERKLKEYGKVIFKTDAINSCIQTFL